MKKIIIISAIILAIILVLSVAAMLLLRPEKMTLEGTYSTVNIGTGRTLEFDGDKVTATHMSQNVISYSFTGTYEITDGYIIITFNPEDAERATIFAGRRTFELGDGYIKIDGAKYTKVE